MQTLRPEHAAKVAKLHGATLGGLLTRLGEPLLRTFYSAASLSPQCVGFVSGEDSFQGFVFGAVDTQRLSRELMSRSPVRLALSVAGGVLRKPSTLRLLWSSTVGRGDEVPDLGAAQLTYLAVAPEARRQGVARELVAAFDREMAKRHLGSYELSVVAENRSATEFYGSLGFVTVLEYEEFGERYLRLRRDLDGQGVTG